MNFNEYYVITLWTLASLPAQTTDKFYAVQLKLLHGVSACTAY